MVKYENRIKIENNIMQFVLGQIEAYIFNGSN